MDPVTVTVKGPIQSTVVQVSDTGNSISTGADVVTFSPDGKTRHSQNQEQADEAELGRIAGLIKADPHCVQGITPEAWTELLVAEDKRARAAATPADPEYRPNFPLGPYGVKYEDEAIHDNGPASPFAGGTWPMDDPSGYILDWYGAPPELAKAMADWLAPILAQMKLITRPGYRPGWGPVV
jgi:hypothetical protein